MDTTHFDVEQHAALLREWIARAPWASGCRLRTLGELLAFRLSGSRVELDGSGASDRVGVVDVIFIERGRLDIFLSDE